MKIIYFFTVKKSILPAQCSNSTQAVNLFCVSIKLWKVQKRSPLPLQYNSIRALQKPSNYRNCTIGKFEAEGVPRTPHVRTRNPKYKRAKREKNQFRIEYATSVSETDVQEGNILLAYWYVNIGHTPASNYPCLTLWGVIQQDPYSPYQAHLALAQTSCAWMSLKSFW